MPVFWAPLETKVGFYSIAKMVVFSPIICSCVGSTFRSQEGLTLFILFRILFFGAFRKTKVAITPYENGRVLFFFLR